MGVVLSSSGQLENRGDSDWFRAHLVAGRSYQLVGSLQVIGGYPTLSIILPEGQPLVFPLGSRDFVAPTTGDYFVTVGATGNDGIYRLQIEEVDPIPTPAATTMYISPDQTVSVERYGTNWFAIDVAAGQSYVLASDSLATPVYVVNAEGHVLAMEESGGQQVHFTALESERLFVGVNASHPSNLTFHSVIDDHGATPSAAGNFEIGTAVTGAWEAAGDDDWYAIALEEGASYRLSLAPSDSGLRTHVTVANASGTVVWESGPFSQGESYSTIFSTETAGTYYVSASLGVVTTFSTWPDEYLAGWSYSLSATEMPDDIIDNRLTAHTLSADAAVAATWEIVGDRDWLSVQLTEGQSYAFTLAAIEGNSNRVGMTLFDADGNELVLSMDSGSGAWLHHTAAGTGTYYLSANSGLMPGDYLVSMAKVADDFVNNDSTTGRISVGGTATGTWEANADSDWFAVDLVVGRTYLLEGQGRQTIRDAQGRDLTPGDDVSFTPAASGTYYLETRGGGGASYSVAIREVFDDYLENNQTTGVLRQSFEGTAGVDVLIGTRWHDQLSGWDGDDLLIAGRGYDFFEGGPGVDTLSYADSSRAVTVDLMRAGSFVGDRRDDTIFFIETIVGSNFNDRLSGTPEADRLEGGDGDDLLKGGGGADWLIGGAGSDTVAYDDSSHGMTLYLASGRGFGGTAEGDRLTSVENATGSNFADILIGSDAANRLLGGLGDDRLDGRGGADAMWGGAGNDRYDVNDAGDRVIEALGEGTDTVLASADFRLALNIENLSLLGDAVKGVGNGLDNVIVGNGANNLLYGGGRE